MVSSVSAITGSIGNARVVLRPEVDKDEIKIIDRTIMVENVNDVDIKVTLSPDYILESFSEIIDKEFVLKPGESKDARFKLKLENTGTYTGKLIVKFSELEGKSPGVALSSSIIIIAEGSAPEFVEPEKPEDKIEVEVEKKIEEKEEDVDGKEEVNIQLGDIKEKSSISGSVVKKIGKISPSVLIFIVLVILVLGLGSWLIIKKRKK